jgi:hypothetical protein
LKCPTSGVRAMCLASTAGKAQVTTSVSLPVQGTATGLDFEFRLDGSIVEEGSGSSLLNNTDLRAASRFLWIPSLNALVAGSGISTETTLQVGVGSIALGRGAAASGIDSVALGNGSSSTGTNTLATGGGGVSGGFDGIAMGSGANSGASETIAIGGYADAGAQGAIAIGYDSTANGEYSSAIGQTVKANGYASTAMSVDTTANGELSTAQGYKTTATAAGDFVVGSLNTGMSEPGATTPQSSTTWVSSDPLFEIGDGNPTLSSPTPSDALVIYKNGDAVFSGPGISGNGVSTVTAPTFVTTQASGDIPMYTGN